MIRRKLIKKFLLIMLVIIVTIMSTNCLNVVNAIDTNSLRQQLQNATSGGGSLNNAVKEALYRAGVKVDGPPSYPGIGGTTTNNVVIKQRILTLTAQRKIEGNAFEDIPRLVENSNKGTSDLSTRNINTNASKDSDEPAISNIVVELLNSNDEVVKTTTTNENRTLYI